MNRIFYVWPLILQTCIWPVVRPAFWFFLRLEVHGLEHLQHVLCKYDRTYTVQKRGVIFAANHSSELDSIFIPASLPFLSAFMPMFYTSRDASFYKHSGWRQRFYGGLLFKLWGAHRLQPAQNDYEHALKTHIGIVRDGKCLIMFPDGKRLPEAEIGSIARGGIGYLAWRTEAAVVPVRITDAYQISPVDFLLRRRHVRVTFGEPISSAELVGTDTPSVEACKQASRSIMARIRSLAPSP